jgi:hypothetical protein
MAADVKRIDSATSVQIDDVEPRWLMKPSPPKLQIPNKYRPVARRVEGVVPLVALWQ